MTASGRLHRSVLNRKPRQSVVHGAASGAAFIVLSLMVAATASGCEGSSTSTTYTPYTGVNFQPTTLLQGVGCGTSDGQVYRYAVILADPVDGGPPSLSALSDGAPAAFAGVFGCSVTGVFESLPTAPNGGPTIEAWVFAFDQADYSAAVAALPDLACPASCPLTLADAEQLMQLPSTYTTTCVASPESGDNVLASCQPLLTRLSADGGAADAGFQNPTLQGAAARAGGAQDATAQ